MDRRLAIVGLSARAFLVMREIAREPVHSQAALAARLALEPGTISELLRRLERRALVRRGAGRSGGLSREPRGPGRPALVPVLTESGARVLADAMRAAARLEREWAERLASARHSPWPLARAMGLRRWLVESLEVMGERPAAPGERPAMPDRRPARPRRARPAAVRPAGERPAPGRR